MQWDLRSRLRAEQRQHRFLGKVGRWPCGNTRPLHGWRASRWNAPTLQDQSGENWCSMVKWKWTKRARSVERYTMIHLFRMIPTLFGFRSHGWISEFFWKKNSPKCGCINPKSPNVLNLWAVKKRIFLTAVDALCRGLGPSGRAVNEQPGLYGRARARGGRNTGNSLQIFTGIKLYLL